MDKDLLGRRIIDLIEENEIKLKENEEIQDIELSNIKPNPNQPRVNFDSQGLKYLAESIKVHGVIQPVILKPSHDGFILVAGERRVRASIIAGKKTVPAIVRDYNAIYLTELSILENLQREDLTPIEEAVAYEKAIKSLGLTQAELAKKIGKSRSYVTNVLGLLNLPISVIQDVNQGLISMGHAKILSKLDDTSLIFELSKKIKADKVTVRKLEELTRKHDSSKSKVKKKEAMLKPYESVITKTVKNSFGENVKINIRNNEVRIKFTDLKSLEKLK